MLTDNTTVTFDSAFISMPDAEDGVDGLIGRDLLASLHFDYRGSFGTFSLTRD